MNTIKSYITSFMVVILMAASLSACGSKDDSPTAEPLDNSIVAAAEAMTDTLASVGEEVIDPQQYAADVQRSIDETAAFQEAIRKEGYNLTDDAKTCSAELTTQAKHACVNGMWAKLRMTYPDIIVAARGSQTGASQQAQVALGALSRANKWATSVWLCLKPGETLTGPSLSGKTITVSFPRGAKLVNVQSGALVNLEDCPSKCHGNTDDNGNPTSNAECHILTVVVPPPGGNGNGNGSGNGNDGQANARADAEARARAEVDVDVEIDVRVQVQATLVAAGVQVTPPPTNGGCICTMIWDPVCVSLPGGGTMQFSNGCFARCAGFSRFVDCYATATPVAVDDRCGTACGKHWNSPYEARAYGCYEPYTIGSCPTATPGASPTATRALATATLAPGPATPVATLPVATPTDCGAELIRTTPFDSVSNIDWGDPQNWTIIQFWNGKDADTTVQAAIAPGYNLDVEADRLVGTAWIFKGTREQVICRARQMADEHGGIKLLVWVGPDPVPSGFEKPSDKLGYKMSTWQYGTGIIETPGASWTTEQLPKGKGHVVCNNGDGFTYLQLWAPPNASRLYHVILEKGACMRTPDDLEVQGSVWHVSGGVRAAVLARLNQMSDEAQDRDNPDSLHRWFIGCEESPSGWNTPSSDWVVVRSASC